MTHCKGSVSVSALLSAPSNARPPLPPPLSRVVVGSEYGLARLRRFAAVGCPDYSSTAMGSGAVYIFEPEEAKPASAAETWVLTQRLEQVPARTPQPRSVPGLWPDRTRGGGKLC